MIDIAADWLRDNAGKLLVCGAGALLALSLFSLGTSLLSDGSTETEAQTDRLAVKLQGDLRRAQDGLTVKHENLLADLPGADSERVGRDEATGRSVLLSLVDSSASTRTTRQTQVLLDGRYDFLTPASRVLTEFIPEWMAATGSSQGVGTTFALGELTIDVNDAQNLDHSYVGLARFDPIARSGSSTAKSEHVLFAYSTKQDGTVASFEVYRASSRTRDVLAAEQERKSAAAGSTPPPAPPRR